MHSEILLALLLSHAHTRKLTPYELKVTIVHVTSKSGIKHPNIIVAGRIFLFFVFTSADDSASSWRNLVHAGLANTPLGQKSQSRAPWVYKT